MRFGLEQVIILKKLTDHQPLQDEKQEGNYFDSFKNDFDYDKRNQKFQTSDGFRSYYSLDLPLSVTLIP